MPVPGKAVTRGPVGAVAQPASTTPSMRPSTGPLRRTDFFMCSLILRRGRDLLPAARTSLHIRVVGIALGAEIPVGTVLLRLDLAGAGGLSRLLDIHLLLRLHDDRRAQHDRSGVDRRRIVGVVVGRTVVARIGVEMRPVIAGPVVTRTIAVMAVHRSAEGE